MNPVAVLVLADTQTHADLGRVVNAMMVAKELKEAGDEVQIIFDGAGTQWLGELSEAGHRAHPLFEDVKDVVSGACGFCAHAFEAEEGVSRAEVPKLEEYHDHPSIRKLLASGHQVITF